MILSIKVPRSLPAPSNLPMWNGMRTRIDIQSSKKYCVSLQSKKSVSCFYGPRRSMEEEG
jgi:hypothetical protein